MEYLAQKKFTFRSAALPDDTFGVVEFHGREGLSQCYEFQILLLCGNSELPLGTVVENPATLGRRRMDGQTIFHHGILERFEQLQEVGRCACYRATLVPRLSRLRLIRHSQVFLNRSVPECVEACLKDGGMTAGEYEFRLQHPYPALEYVCQYDESHLDFISRWLEHEGMYYFFEQTPGGEKVVFTDTKAAHSAHPRGKTVRYHPPSALESFETEEVVQAWRGSTQSVPASVRVRDYNSQKPSLDVSGTAEVDAHGRGQVYQYGETASTPDEAHRLARLYAETLYCRRELFEGEGSAPFLAAGYTIELADHYRDSFNRPYLLTEVWHEGSQAGYLLAELKQGLEGDRDRVFYRNRCQAIPAEVQFRPQHHTPRPRVAGTVPAHVDAAGSGQYAELDEQGRYKVALPFDLSGRQDGKASAWFQMASPYAGPDHGLHFPLHKGTEVLLTFRDGDPDRPIIAAAVPNPGTPSPVTGANQTAAVIRTGSGNRIQFEDRAGSERILLESPNQSSFIRIGAPNDPPLLLGQTPPTTTPDPDETTTPGEESWDGGSANWSKWGIAEKTKGGLEMEARAKNVTVLGSATDTVLGARTELAVGGAVNAVLGGNFTFYWPGFLKIFNLSFLETKKAFAAEVVEVTDELAEKKAGAAEHKVHGETAHLYAHQLETQLHNSNDNLLNIVALDHRADAVLQDVRAQQLKLDDTGRHLQVMGTHLRDAAQEMGAAGQHITHYGAHVATNTTQVKKSLKLVEEGGTIFERNLVHFEG